MDFVLVNMLTNDQLTDYCLEILFLNLTSIVICCRTAQTHASINDAHSDPVGMQTSGLNWY